MNLKTQFLIFVLALFINFGLLETAVRAQQQTVGANTVTVLTYQESGEVRVRFGGENGVGGVAKIERKRSDKTEIALKLNNLPPVTRFGEKFTTYVLWTVSQDGETSNLMEIESPDSAADSPEYKKEEALSSFGLILTAESYASVHRPGGKVVAVSHEPMTGYKDGVRDIKVEYKTDTSECLGEEPPVQTRDARKRQVPTLLIAARLAVSRARCEGAELYRESIAAYNEAVIKLLEGEAMWTNKGSNKDQRELNLRQAIERAARAVEVAARAREKRQNDDRIIAEKQRLEKKIEECEAISQDFEGKWRREKDKLDRLEVQKLGLEKESRENNARLNEKKAENDKLNEEIKTLRKENQILQTRLARVELRALLQEFGEIVDEGKGLSFNFALEKLPGNLPKPDFSPAKLQKIESLLAKLAGSKKYKINFEFAYEGYAEPELWENLAQTRADLLGERAQAIGIAANLFRVSKKVNVLPPATPAEKKKPSVDEHLKVTIEFADASGTP
jgi:hypothetical protein